MTLVYAPIEQLGFIRDDFGGPGGWSEGLAMLELAEVGVEFEPDACATARLACHKRWLADVTSDAVRDFAWPSLWGYIASPPCQTFSRMGSGSGRLHMASLILAMKHVASGMTPAEAVALVSDEALDERSVLVLEPLLVIRDHRPVWVAMEQVPGVLPIWEAYAVILRAWGYDVATGRVSSEAYGVPQVRTRAVLVANRTRLVGLPPASHSRYHSRTPERLDGGLVLPWVTMAAALGPDWTPTFADQSGTPVDQEWPAKRPSTTVAGRGLVQNPGATANRFNGSTKSRNDGVRVTVAEAAVLQSFRADYPWQGSLTSQYQQVGNAVPPLVAAALVRAAIGSP